MIRISDHFTFKKLIKYTFPSVIMMVFSSIYVAVDGLFISNYVGKTSFAAINYIIPFLLFLSGVGFMFGSGASALIGKTLGENKKEKANEIFSLLIYVSLASGVLLTIIGYLLIKPVAIFLGAEGQLLEDSLTYGRIYLLGVPFCMIQYEFQYLFVTAEKPRLGLYSTLISGFGNIIFDFLLVAVFRFGLEGAAAATVISQFIGGVHPLIYFSMKKNKSLLRFCKTKFDGKALLKICANGSSEAVNNASMSALNMIYNAQLLAYAGNDGIAAYGAIMYVNFLFISVLIGFTVGVCPLISYHFGAQNKEEVRGLLKKSLLIVSLLSLSMFITAELACSWIAKIFVGYDAGLYEMTMRGFFIFSFSFIFVGVAIFSSSFFTALNNGLISAILSFMRTVVFQVLAVMLLPLILDLDGIWIATVLAELSTVLLSSVFLLANRKKYKY